MTATAIDVRSPALAAQQAGDTPGEWRVPVEMAEACTSSAQRMVIRFRRTRGDMPQPTARVWTVRGRFFAEVFFYGPGRPSIVFSLDCWCGCESGSRGLG